MLLGVLAFAEAISKILNFQQYFQQCIHVERYGDDDIVMEWCWGTLVCCMESRHSDGICSLHTSPAEVFAPGEALPRIAALNSCPCHCLSSPMLQTNNHYSRSPFCSWWNSSVDSRPEQLPLPLATNAIPIWHDSIVWPQR